MTEACNKVQLIPVHCADLSNYVRCNMPDGISDFFQHHSFACRMIFSLYMMAMPIWNIHGIPQPDHLSYDHIRISYFMEDVTPPLESPLAFGTARIVHDSLSARGIVLQFDEYPVVLCAVDWIGISNEGMDYFKEKLAEAVETKPERISVHALHLHDGVRGDLTAPRLLDRYGESEIYYDTIFLRHVIDRVAFSARKAMEESQPVTHIGFGQARVKKVASNRRILNRAGKVQAMRWNNTSNWEIRNEPEGLIDPMLKMVTFWNGEDPVVSMSYYAVHPVTYFGEGIVSADFVGIARKNQENRQEIPQIYFTGAAGNIGTGKYNDGSVRIRQVLAARLSQAMEEAFAQTIRFSLEKKDVKWKSAEVYLPLASFMIKDSLESILAGELYDPELPFLRSISSLAWLERVHRKPEVQVSALHIKEIRLLHLPGEPFVEYQLAAQKYFPDLKICTAAYGEYGMGYIGTAIAYDQGGYETSKMASNVSPEAEKDLLTAIRKVLE